MKRLLIILFLVIISCNRDKEYYSHTETEILSEDTLRNELPPPPRAYQNYYVISKGDSICKTEIRSLYNVYLIQKKWANFEAFLYDALNQKTKFQSCLYFYPEECFVLNSSVTKNYNNNTFEAFLNIYCKKAIPTGNTFYFKEDIIKDDISSISYYLFLNKYIVAQDCVSGYLVINKIDI